MTLNEYLMQGRNVASVYLHICKRITCANGFSISVQANEGAYCLPRENYGPWTAVECGYPSSAPESILSFAQEPESPTETVYAYVPIDTVEALLAAHGGAIYESES